MQLKKSLQLAFPSVFYLLIIFLLGVWVFHKTFQLSLMGDEWQMVWVIKGSIETTGSWDYGIRLFHWQGYQFGALMMHFLAEYFGTDGKAVYITSFITRFLAASTLYYFLKKRGLNNIAAFLGSLLFMIIPIGLQTTDWAKNFTSYLSIIFFLLCIDSIFNIRHIKMFRVILIFSLSFAISIYVNPIRAHGIIITVFLLLFFQLIFNKLASKKTVIFLLLGSIGILLLFSKMMMFGNSAKSPIGFIWQLGLIFNKIFSSDLINIRNLFVLIGNGVLPKSSLAGILSLVAILLIWKKYLFNKQYLIFTLLFNFFFLLFLLRFNSEIKIIAGIYFTLFSIVTFLIELFNKRILESMITIFLFLLNISFILLPWALGVFEVTESTNRYLIYSAMSIPIIAAFSLNQNKLNNLKDFLFSPLKLSSITFIVSFVLLIIYFSTTKSEINNMFLRHNQYAAKIIWQRLYPYFDNFDFKTRRPVIFIESDNPAMLHDTVLFGIDYRLGIKYRIWEESKLPIAVDSIKDLTSIISDGKVGEKYMQRSYIFPKEDAFYFQIDGNNVSRIDISTLQLKSESK